MQCRTTALEHRCCELSSQVVKRRDRTRSTWKCHEIDRGANYPAEAYKQSKLIVHNGAKKISEIVFEFSNYCPFTRHFQYFQSSTNQKIGKFSCKIVDFLVTLIDYENSIVT